MAETWRRCSACKTDIPLGGLHYVCSVSTCNRKRTGLVFCSVDCWEIHLPTERHREAWAVEARAPKTREPEEKPAPRKPASKTSPASGAAAPKSSPTVIRRRRDGAPPNAVIHGDPAETEILVVASRLKQYVKQASGFNTSDRVLPVLSTALRKICDEAIENARRAERLTVLDRDVPRD